MNVFICEDYLDNVLLLDKNRKHLLLTEFIFICNNLRVSGKILLAFCLGNQGDVNLLVGLQNDIMNNSIWLRLISWALLTVNYGGPVVHNTTKLPQHNA